MDTTAGSFALQGALVPGDATCVARLREAGAIVLCKLPLLYITWSLAYAWRANTGKANLSVFGNFRGVASG